MLLLLDLGMQATHCLDINSGSQVCYLLMAFPDSMKLILTDVWFRISNLLKSKTWGWRMTQCRNCFLHKRRTQVQLHSSCVPRLAARFCDLGDGKADKRVRRIPGLPVQPVGKLQVHCETLPHSRGEEEARHQCLTSICVYMSTHKYVFMSSCC